MAESEEQKRAKEKEAKMDDLIKQMAQIIIDENQEIVGSDIAEKAKEKVKRKRTTKKAIKTEEEEG